MNSSSNPDSDEDNASLVSPAAAQTSEEVLLLNRQRRARADWAEVRHFLRRLSSTLLKPGAGLTVCLVSDAGIRRYNKRFRGIDRSTDVLSFPSGNGMNGNGEYLGDIVISAETAQGSARRFGWRLEEEIELLALHGVLHLLGHDHERDNGEMARLERDWSRRLGLGQSLTGRMMPRKAKQKGREGGSN
jgi:probable rRNA maturation factor